MGEADSSIPILPPQFGKARCPRCGATLRLPESSRGRKVKCPTCDHKWRNGDPTDAPAVAAGPASHLPTLPDLGPHLPPSHQMLLPPGGLPPPPPKDPTVTAKISPSLFRRRPRGPEFEPIDCAVLVADAATGAEERAAGLIFCEGLLLTQGGERTLIPLGAQAEYEGDDRLSVQFEGRRLGLRLLRPMTKTNTLAFDLARFLNRQLEALDLELYLKPTYLYLLACLPLGLILITGFAPLWSGLAVIACLICLGIARAEKLPFLSKLLGVFGLSVIAYVVWALVALPTYFEEQRLKAKPTATKSTPSDLATTPTRR